MPMIIRPIYVAVILAVGVAFATATPGARAVLIISSNPDVLAGRNTFLAAGSTTTQFNWDSIFAPNAHTTGQLPPVINTPSVSVTLPDSTVNTVVGANTHPAALSLGNWVDAPGFNGLGNSAAADLAINGVESFDLVFGNGHRSVGLAIITGTGNLPNEVDSTGAMFTFTARDESSGLIGIATFSLAPDRVDQAWLSITSDMPFRRLEVREVGAASIADQYFSNMLTSVTVVPEVSGLALLSTGAFGLLARGHWRHRTRLSIRSHSQRLRA